MAAIRVNQALKAIAQTPTSYAVLDLDHELFCVSKVSKNGNEVTEAVGHLVEVFCGSEEQFKLNAGILLFDIFRANITPLTQEVSLFVSN